MNNNVNMESAEDFTKRVMSNWMDWIDNYQRMNRMVQCSVKFRKELNKVRFLYMGGFATKEDVRTAQKKLSKSQEIYFQCSRYHSQFSFQQSFQE